MKQFNRKEILQISSTLLSTAVLFPLKLKSFTKEHLSTLPTSTMRTFSLMPNVSINENGYLTIKDSKTNAKEMSPQFQTLWNRNRNFAVNRLSRLKPWGIVLHWYGDEENFFPSIENYLEGFNEIRNINQYQSSTSAHFLIGKYPSKGDKDTKISDANFGILQMQAPDDDGTPFTASHIRTDMARHENNYFTRGSYQLQSQFPKYSSIITQFAENSKWDINEHTIAIELTGINFDEPGFYPNQQQIANVLSCVISIMKRYKIPLSNILGHHEIDSQKADPGKNFLAHIKLLIGVYAFEQNDRELMSLSFSQFQENVSGDENSSFLNYFGYLIQSQYLLNSPKYISEWEEASKFWEIYDFYYARHFPKATTFSFPLNESETFSYGAFTDNQNTSGMRVYTNLQNESVTLIGNGECVEKTQSGNYGNEKQIIIFKHRLSNGREYLSIYDNLTNTENIKIGNHYLVGKKIGDLSVKDKSQNPFLHFSIAYGSSWETYINQSNIVPPTLPKEQLLTRYVNPFGFVSSFASPKQRKVAYNNY